MKTIMKQRKLTAVILASMLFLQGCSVYKSEYLSLESAVKITSKVKLEYYSGEKQKFKKIIEENSAFYGIKKRKGNYENVPLNSETIKNIREKDITASTILTIALPIGIIAGGLFIFQDAFMWKSDTVDLSL